MFLPLTPVRFLYRACDRFPSHRAVVAGEHCYSYEQFTSLCLRLAAGLRRLQIRPGDRVAFLSFNTEYLLAGYFAPLLLGAIFLPLNARLTTFELASILRQTSPRVLLVEPELLPLVATLHGPQLRIVLFADLPEGSLDRPDLAAIDESTTAALYLTSGSTAEPQVVPLTHRSLYLHTLSLQAALPQTPRELHAVSLFHANGWGRPHLATLCGATHILLHRFTPDGFFRLLRREEVTGTSLVPVMAEMLLRHPDRHPGSLRQLHLGGAPIPPDLMPRLRQQFGWQVSAGYGLTEAGPVVATSSDGRQYTPIPGVEVRLAKDAELWFRSSGGCSSDWTPTGDLATPEGGTSFGIFDRKKDVIISGGQNIASPEVEMAVQRHPAVLDCAVVAGPDPQWGEMPVAFVVLRPGATLDLPSLRSFLKPQLAGYKLPRRLELVTGDLPRSASGKVLKRLLRTTPV